MDSIEAIISKNERSVLNVLRNMSLTEEECLDVAQEVFMKVYRNLDKFRGESDIKTWIYRITFRSGLDYIRKKKRLRETPLEGKQEFRDTTKSQRESLGEEEKKNMVRKAVNRLHPRYREIIILRELEGLSYSQIADVLRCSIGTVESRLSRARGELKKILRPYREEMV